MADLNHCFVPAGELCARARNFVGRGNEQRLVFRDDEGAPGAGEPETA